MTSIDVPMLSGHLHWVILVRIFLYLDWVRSDILYWVQVRENTDQNNSEYGHFYAVLSRCLTQSQLYDTADSTLGFHLVSDV